MADGLPDLVSHVRLDTTGVAAGVAKTKAELGGLGGATKTLEKDFKGLLGSITGVGGGTSQLSGVFSKFTSSVGQARSAMSGVAGEGSKLTSVLTGVGVGVAGVGLALGALAVEGIGKFVAAAGQVRSLQATLGSTAGEASKLRNVAVGLGVDVDTMGKALFKLGPILEKNKGDLAGVHVELAKNADGSSNLVGTLDNMRTAYQGLTDSTQKAQFLQEAFKKTGLDLRPILSANADLFAKLAANGPIFNDKDLKAAKELGIAQRELKQAVDSAEISLARGLLPTITKVTDQASDLVGVMQRLGGGVGGLASHLGPLKTVFENALNPITRTQSILHLLHLTNDKGKGSAAAHAEAEQKLADSLKEAADKADAAAAAFDKLVGAQESSLDKDLAMDRALRASVQSADGVTKAQLALAQANQTVAEKQAALTKAQKDGDSTAVEIRGAALDLQSAQLAVKDATQGVIDAQNAQRDALIDAAKAVRDKQVADREANGETVTAEAKVRLFILALRDQAGTLAPGSELRTNLNAYADKLEHGIPKSVNTTINLDAGDANARLDALQARLAQLNTSIEQSGPGGGRGAERNQVQSEIDSTPRDDQRPADEPNARGNRLGVRGIIPLAGGGRTSGFRTSGPRFLVGEGDRRYPETVIASDPQFRERNLSLYAMAGRDLGVGAGGPSTINISPADVVVVLDGQAVAKGTVKFMARELHGMRRR